MYAVATFLIVAVITSVFSLMATGALIATGVPSEIASFQARSALTGSGFTTTEAENVVNHPARRRIVSTAMFVGNLGTPTLVVSVLIGLLAPGPGSTAERSLVATSGVLIILLLIGNRPVKRAMVRVGQHYARRRLLPALVVGPEQLLSLGRDFSVTAVRVAETPKDTYRSLRELEGAIPEAKILGVRRGTEYFGEPPVDIALEEGDELVVYARNDRLRALGAPASDGSSPS